MRREAARFGVLSGLYEHRVGTDRVSALNLIAPSLFLFLFLFLSLCSSRCEATDLFGSGVFFLYGSIGDCFAEDGLVLCSSVGLS